MKDDPELYAAFKSSFQTGDFYLTKSLEHGDTFSPVGLSDVTSVMDYGAGIMPMFDVLVDAINSVAKCLYDTFTKTLESDTSPASLSLLGICASMKDDTPAALPQDEFTKTVGLSVSSRRESAEAKHLSRISKRR